MSLLALVDYEWLGNQLAGQVQNIKWLAGVAKITTKKLKLICSLITWLLYHFPLFYKGYAPSEIITEAR